jgi:CRP-like cAMP-binding protein
MVQLGERQAETCVRLSAPDQIVSLPQPSARLHRRRDAQPAKPPPITANRLLAHLPEDVYLRLLSSLETVPLSYMHRLQQPDEPIESIHFLTRGGCSLTHAVGGQRLVEIADIGVEGCLNINALVGGTRSIATALVHIPGSTAQVMSLTTFQQEIARGGPFAAIMNRYLEVYLETLMQTIACSALHSVQQRCATWLLRRRDRIGQNQFPLTQEYLALMLGVRRATVTEIARGFQNAGVVDYRHRLFVILDAEILQARACECYVRTSERFRTFPH